MRWSLVVSVTLLLPSSIAAQTPSRWTFSAGPEWRQWWGTRLWGIRLRAEYDLTRPSSVFGLRLEGGARWGPTQSYFSESGSRSVGGVDQMTDIMLGFSGAISPFPRGRLSPYVTMGVFGRQTWDRGSFFLRDTTAALSWNRPYSSDTRGDIIATVGLGLRARLGGRSFQLEIRRIHSNNGLTFGTRLPF
jgi:hypothetical protein